MPFFRVFTICWLLLTPAFALAQAAERRIVVSGDGRVAAVPDMAIVNIGVSREAETAGAAMDAASEAMAAVRARIAGMGIDDSDVQTTRIGLQPRYARDAPDISGYLASNTLRIRVRELSALGGMLDAVIGEGANDMGGLSFTLGDPRPLEDAARAGAVADAFAKAKTLTDAAGLSLGPVLSIEEVRSVGGPQPMSMMESAGARAAVPIAAGEIEVTVSVTVVFGIGE